MIEKKHAYKAVWLYKTIILVEIITPKPIDSTTLLCIVRLFTGWNNCKSDFLNSSFIH